MCPKGTDERCVMGCFLEMGQAIWELLEGDVEAMRVSMRKGKGMICRIIWSKSLSVIPGEIENEKTVLRLCVSFSLTSRCGRCPNALPLGIFRAS